jgi:hypothetical protein
MSRSQSAIRFLLHFGPERPRALQSNAIEDLSPVKRATTVIYRTQT